MLLVIIKLMILPATLCKQINEIVINFSNDNSPVGFTYGAFLSRALRVFSTSFSTACAV